MDDFGGYEEPTSRAFWRSEDLEEDSTVIPTFTLEWLSDSPSLMKTVVVVTGKIVTGILDRCIIDSAVRICTINCTEEFNVAALYKLNNDVYICMVTSSVDVASAGNFMDAISGIITRSENIIVFTDESISNLNGMERTANSPTLWRSLCTRKGREQTLKRIPSLKHPNFIVGVAAAVVGYAEMMDLPAVLYILYISDDVYDVELVDPLIKLFTEVTNIPAPKIDSNSKPLNTNKLKLYI